MSNLIKQTQPVTNHTLQSYTVETIQGKRVLVTTDGRTSFPFGTKEEQNNTMNYFKEGK